VCDCDHNLHQISITHNVASAAVRLPAEGVRPSRGRTTGLTQDYQQRSPYLPNRGECWVCRFILWSPHRRMQTTDIKSLSNKSNFNPPLQGGAAFHISRYSHVQYNKIPLMTSHHRMTTPAAASPATHLMIHNDNLVTLTSCRLIPFFFFL